MPYPDSSSGSRLDRALQRDDHWAEQDRVTPMTELHTCVTCPKEGCINGAVEVNGESLECPICQGAGVCLEQTALIYLRARESLR